ncbi:PIN domain-containing protein [Streptomyces parvus]|uniref:PIN domain-containing protein n=1 Tax=Streptomyces parvus TaxID=66428 RepID=UPI00332BC610
MSDSISSSFTQGYEEFWRKSQEFIDSAIAASTVVLDTNAILNLYRMKPSARAEYFQVLQKIESRIWIPRQVADEFHRNRLSAVDSHANSLKSKSDKVSESAESLRFALRDFFKLHSLADGKSSGYLESLNESVSRIVNSVKREVEEYDLKPSDLLSGDPILERLALLFEGKVGSGVPMSERKAAMDEALRRGAEGVPPGYKDVKERGEKGVGDYFIWREMIDHAKLTERDILFVSTDLKDDWVRKQCGFSIGPLPELVEEMRISAGVQYHHLPLAIFLSRAAVALKVPVSQDTINQVKDGSISSETRDLVNEVREWQKVLGSTEQNLRAAQQQVGFLHHMVMNADREASAARHSVNNAEKSDADMLNQLREFSAAEEKLRRRVAELEEAKDLLADIEREHAIVRHRYKVAHDGLMAMEHEGAIQRLE